MVFTTLVVFIAAITGVANALSFETFRTVPYNCVYENLSPFNYTLESGFIGPDGALSPGQQFTFERYGLALPVVTTSYRAGYIIYNVTEETIILTGADTKAYNVATGHANFLNMATWVFDGGDTRQGGPPNTPETDAGPFTAGACGNVTAYYGNIAGTLEVTVYNGNSSNVRGTPDGEVLYEGSFLCTPIGLTALDTYLNTAGDCPPLAGNSTSTSTSKIGTAPISSGTASIGSIGTTHISSSTSVPVKTNTVPVGTGTAPFSNGTCSGTVTGTGTGYPQQTGSYYG